MKVAMFVKNERMARPNSEAMCALIFNIEEGKITGMEDVFLYNMTVNYISLWLLARDINVFYILDIKEEDRSFFKKIGITAKTFKEINDGHIFWAFIK